MKFSVTFPMMTRPFTPELLTTRGVTDFARATEAAGFDGIGFTDHPAPTERWLAAGGHDALDPFAALAFVAAVTERIRLIPNIVVLPYRNPFLVAKSVATLHALSDGRFTLGTGTGYLKGEYKALGVDFDERNALFDETLEVLRAIWTRDDVSYQGLHFEARGQTANPKPGHVPIWIGGNSQLSRRRVATVADGWVPFVTPRGSEATVKTAPLETPADLAEMLDYLWRHVEEAGRERSEIDISFASTVGGLPEDDDFDADAHIEAITALAEIGVTWIGINAPGDSAAHALETVERYGEQVIARFPG